MFAQKRTRNKKNANKRNSEQQKLFESVKHIKPAWDDSEVNFFSRPCALLEPPSMFCLLLGHSLLRKAQLERYRGAGGYGYFF